MEFLGYIDDIILWVTAAIGAASLIVKGLQLIANVTPSQKDNQWLSEAQKVIVKIQAILDRIALNPDNTEARKKPKQ